MTAERRVPFDPLSLRACGITLGRRVMAGLGQHRLGACALLIASVLSGVDASVRAYRDAIEQRHAERLARAERWRTRVELLQSYDATDGSFETVRIALAETLDDLDHPDLQLREGELLPRSTGLDADVSTRTGIRVRLSFETSETVHSLAALERLATAAAPAPSEVAGCRWQRVGDALSGECALDVYTEALPR